MIVGGYSLDLYCENENVHGIFSNGTYYYSKDEHSSPVKEVKHQFVNETFSGCAKQAREYGWTVNRKKNRAICPVCNGRWKGDKE